MLISYLQSKNVFFVGMICYQLYSLYLNKSFPAKEQFSFVDQW